MPPRNNKPRLSLFELTLVGAVLVFIGGSAGVAALPRCIMPKTQQARSELTTIELAAEVARMEMGESPEIRANCPTVDTLIRSHTLSPTTSARDPWDHPYRIVCDTSGVRALSAGPDGELGTRDDP